MIRASRNRGIHRASIVFILGALLLSFFAPLVPTPQNTASAIGSASEMTPDDVALSFALYYGVVGCLVGEDSIKNDDIIDGKPVDDTVNSWYIDTAVGNGTDGKSECNTVIKAAVNLWGYGSLDLALEAWGYKNPGDGGDWKNDNPGTDSAKDIRNHVYSGSQPTFPGEAQYVYYKSTLVAVCKISDPVDFATASDSLKSAVNKADSGYVKVTEPKPDFTGTIDKIYKVGKNSLDNKIFPNNTPSSYSQWQNCLDLAANTSKYAPAFVKWAALNKDAATKLLQASTVTGASGAEKGTNTCSSEIGAIGWIVCPVMTFMAKINDGFFKFISEHFLEVNVNLFNEKSGTFQAWTVFRNYANIAFVIVFLVIIYSQVTSAGISNYGIKRMLPKLIVSAVLVNISFYVCQAAVDLSNLLGYGIKNLFDVVPAVPDDAPKIPNWVDKIAIVLALVGIAAGAVALLLAVSTSVLLAALLAFGMIVLILIARQAVIVLLIVVSPIAFVANMLPNTEGVYKKWFTMFKVTLLVFPIISLVFGASMLAAKVISASAASDGTGTNGVILQLTAMAVTALPLFIVPTLLKGSMAATGAIGSRLSGYADRSGKKVGSSVREKSYAGAYMKQRGKIKQSKRMQRFNDGRVYGAVSRNRFSGQAGTELGAMGTAMASKEEREAVDNEAVRLQKQKGWNESNRLEMAQKAFEDSMKSGNATQARAAQQILLAGGNAGIGRLQEGYEALESDPNYTKTMGADHAQKVLSDLNSAGLKPKNAALAKLGWSAAGTKVSTLAGDASTYTALSDAEIAGQAAKDSTKPNAKDLNFDKAIASGGISAVRAQEIIANQNVWSNLSEDKKIAIRAAAGGAAPTPVAGQGAPQPGPAPAQPSPAPAPAPSGGTPPPSGGNPSQLNIPHTPAPPKGSGGTNAPYNPGGGAP